MASKSRKKNLLQPKQTVLNLMSVPVSSDVINFERISLDQFAQEEIRLGKKVHQNEGIWWIQSGPFYCKSLHEYSAIDRRDRRKRPKRRLSWLGYSFPVKDNGTGNRLISCNVLEGQNLSRFSIMELGQKKRNQVRQGLKNCTIKLLPDVEPWLGCMKRINISQATRFAQIGARKDFLPANYYNDREVQWQEDMKRLFSHRGHHLFGAIIEDRLVAYVDVIQFDDTWMFGAVKSDDTYCR